MARHIKSSSGTKGTWHFFVSALMASTELLSSLNRAMFETKNQPFPIIFYALSNMQRVCKNAHTHNNNNRTSSFISKYPYTMHADICIAIIMKI